MCEKMHNGLWQFSDMQLQHKALHASAWDQGTAMAAPGRRRQQDSRKKKIAAGTPEQGLRDRLAHPIVHMRKAVQRILRVQAQGGRDRPRVACYVCLHTVSLLHPTCQKPQTCFVWGRHLLAACTWWVTHFGTCTFRSMSGYT